MTFYENLNISQILQALDIWPFVLKYVYHLGVLQISNNLRDELVWYNILFILFFFYQNVFCSVAIMAEEHSSRQRLSSSVDYHLHPSVSSPNCLNFLNLAFSNINGQNYYGFVLNPPSETQISPSVILDESDPESNRKFWILNTEIKNLRLFLQSLQ